MKFSDYIVEKKQITVAVVLNDTKQFLAVKGTNLNHWGVPKGIMESGESIVTTGAREFYEEVGIKLNKYRIAVIGKFPYNSVKDIIVGLYTVDDLPSLSSMNCSSMTEYYGDPVPEIDEYKYIKFEDYKKLKKDYWYSMKYILELKNE
jgi:8-oxo-dGTP pyrophosphatase MutT (NUDIX family)